MSLSEHRELLVLGFIRDHAIHGYALAEALEDGLGSALGIKRPNLYALLQRLEERKLIRHKTVRPGNAPERREYRITAKGKAGYGELLRRCWSAIPDTVLPLAVLLSSLDELPKTERAKAVASAVRELNKRIKAIREIPTHDGRSGAALRLIEQHYALDLKFFRSLE
jgi:DNA-binding PadR family transcriptional regulator